MPTVRGKPTNKIIPKAHSSDWTYGDRFWCIVLESVGGIKFLGIVYIDSCKVEWACKLPILQS